MCFTHGFYVLARELDIDGGAITKAYEFRVIRREA